MPVDRRGGDARPLRHRSDRDLARLRDQLVDRTRYPPSRLRLLLRPPIDGLALMTPRMDPDKDYCARLAGLIDDLR